MEKRIQTCFYFIGLIIVLIVSCTGCNLTSAPNNEIEYLPSGIVRGHFLNVPQPSIWENQLPPKEMSRYLLDSRQIDLRTYNKHQIRRGEEPTFVDELGNEMPYRQIRFRRREGDIFRHSWVGDLHMWQYEP